MDVTAPGAPAADAPDVVELRHVAGLAAGGTVRLPEGGHLVGPTGGSGLGEGDPTRSAFPLWVDEDGVATVGAGAVPVLLDGVTVHEPTVVGGRAITVGDDVFEVHRLQVRPHGPREGGWRRLRRDHAATVPSPLVAPSPPPPATAGHPRTATIGVLAAVAGLVLGLLVDPALLGLAAVGGAVAVAAGVLDARRRGARARDAAAVAASFEDEVARRREGATLRRRADHPDPAEVVARAVARDPRLWWRRAGDDDVATVGVGTGSVAWTPPVHGVDPTFLGDVVARHAVLDAVPVTADLRRPLGVVGEPAAARAVARHVLASLATTTGPADLALALLVAEDRLPAWAWCTALPHLDAVRVRTDPSELDELLATRRQGRLLLVVVDHPDLPATDSVAAPGATRGADEALATLLEAGGEVSALVLAGDDQPLPPAVTAWVEVPGPGGAAEVATATGPATPVVARGLAPHLAEQVARALAPLRDPLADGVAGDAARRGADESDAGRKDGASPRRAVAGPSSADGGDGPVRLVDLLGDSASSVDEVRATWALGAGRAELVAPLGTTGDGRPVLVDLVADGPHGLVAGAEGAGASTLLATLACGLAATTDPDRLGLVLLAAADDPRVATLARLPHVVAAADVRDATRAGELLTDLDRALAHRGEPDHTAPADGERSLATVERLVVVVDDVDAVVAARPGLLAQLADLARRGPDLGVHLLVATRRPAPLLDTDLGGTAGLRVALRLDDLPDALEVVGTGDPARLPPGTSGRGHVRVGGAASRALRVATTGPHDTSDDLVQLVDRCRAAAGRPVPPDAAVDGPTVLVDDGPTLVIDLDADLVEQP